MTVLLALSRVRTSYRLFLKVDSSWLRFLHIISVIVYLKRRLFVVFNLELKLSRKVLKLPARVRGHLLLRSHLRLRRPHTSGCCGIHSQVKGVICRMPRRYYNLLVLL